MMHRPTTPTEFISIGPEETVRKVKTLGHTHFPAWLENNPFFRKVFLLRKLYLSNTSFSHFSQFAEDVSILHLYPKKNDGFFVDVGCFHPKKYNNTFALYRRGWRGVNIDINPLKIAAFDMARPGDTNIACAVSNQTGEAEYFSDGIYSLTISLNKNFAENRGGYISKKTRVDTLTRILDGTEYQSRQIDLLSVDAEAHDFEVIKSLDFKRYSPRLIAVETHLRLLPDVMRTDLYKYLDQLNYCIVGWCGLTLLFASESFQKPLVAQPL